MIDKLKVIITYIFRSWEDEPIIPHPGLKIIPPFIFEAISYFILIFIILNIISYLWSLI